MSIRIVEISAIKRTTYGRSTSALPMDLDGVTLVTPLHITDNHASTSRRAKCYRISQLRCLTGLEQSISPQLWTPKASYKHGKPTYSCHLLPMQQETPISKWWRRAGRFSNLTISSLSGSSTSSIPSSFICPRRDTFDALHGATTSMPCTASPSNFAPPFLENIPGIGHDEVRSRDVSATLRLVDR